MTGLILGIHLGILILIVAIFSYVTIYLLYQNRKQVLNRPVYLIQETSGDLHIE